MAISDLEYADDSDVALIRRTRAGDVSAYARLHERHVGAARALSWRMSRSPADADDLVSEGFARVLAALQRGSGPDTAFRPYLLSTIRRLAYDRTDREQREAPVAHELDPAEGTEVDPVIAGFERDSAAAAFASLPERWRVVLWHTEVEGQRPAEVAELLGMKPNAVAALAYRAREGLRQAYLSQCAADRPEAGTECRFARDRIAAHIRGGLTPAQHQRVDAHLDGCARCRAAYLALADENLAFRGLVAFAVLGPFAAGYLAHHGAAAAAPAVGLRARLGRAVARTAGRAPVASTAVVVAMVGAILLAAVWPASGRAAVRIRSAASSHPSVAPGSTAPPGDGTRVRSAHVDVAPPGPGPTAGSGSSAGPTPAPGSGRRRSTPAGARPVDGPGSPAATTTIPTVTTPATTVPTTTVPTTTTPTTTTPTTTTPTTTVPTTTVPTTTVPVDPARLVVDASSAGRLVRGRPGEVVVGVANVGGSPSGPLALDVALPAGQLRGLPTQPGWACGVATASLRCRHGGLAPGARTTIYVPVAVPAGATSLAGRATAQAGAAARSVTSLALPVDPEGMAARFATIDHGGVATAGNGLLTCPDGDPGCAGARRREGTRLDDDDFAMVPIDVDGDPATANSSSAALSLPAGAQVLSAQLYYGAELAGGEGGSPAADASDAAVGTAVLRAPGGARSVVHAERVDRIGTRYQAVVDVTGAVRAGGAGSWTVGGVQAGTGVRGFAGWSLVVAYRSAAAPLRSLVVLDGLSQVVAHSAVTLDVGGFVVPPAGAVHGTISVVSYEGDAGLAGDQLAVGGHPLSDACHPLGNSFDASDCDQGVPVGGRSPGDANLFGFDLGRFALDGVLPPGSTTTQIGLSTSADVYLPGVVAFAVDQ